MSSPTAYNLRRSNYTLYRAWAGEILLYVGLTMNPNNRFGQHNRMTAWWPWVTNITLEHLVDVTRVDAHTAEHSAIQADHPLFNTAENECLIPGCLDEATNQLLCESHWQERRVGWSKHWSPEGLTAIRDGRL